MNRIVSILSGFLTFFILLSILCIRIFHSHIASTFGLVATVASVLIFAVLFFVRAWMPISQELKNGKTLRQIDPNTFAYPILYSLFGALFTFLFIEVVISLF